MEAKIHITESDFIVIETAHWMTAIPFELEEIALKAFQRRAWVPVGARLPEEPWIDVLCWYQTKGHSPKAYVGRYAQGRWHLPVLGATLRGIVTHWQPLPAGAEEGA